jgi:hypothetical protein
MGSVGESRYSTKSIRTSALLGICAASLGAVPTTVKNNTKRAALGRCPCGSGRKPGECCGPWTLTPPAPEPQQGEGGGE